ncbi:unnamed protein product [Allacma fusca]|uniref:Uncharacterized protein n=1 Tax=Allacma fusca TaxID=39272 RepID=A0A8J2KHA6_9HEXA|nr:unnamed protein product [Allacma fusca]
MNACEDTIERGDLPAYTLTIIIISLDRCTNRFIYKDQLISKPGQPKQGGGHLNPTYGALLQLLVCKSYIIIGIWMEIAMLLDRLKEFAGRTQKPFSGVVLGFVNGPWRVTLHPFKSQKREISAVGFLDVTWLRQFVF